MSSVGSSDVKTILFVTGNAGKLREVQHSLSGLSHIHLEAVGMDLPELQAPTAAQISSLKAVEAFRRVNNFPDGNHNVRAMKEDEGKGGLTPVLVEDTSLGFDVLNGLPGPYIKWFLSSLGSEKLTRLAEGFNNHQDDHHRIAAAVCIFSCCYGVDEVTGEPLVVQFKGVCPGKIVDAPRGENGFGWDAIFAPEQQNPPYAKTFAEMDIAEKNKISHRSKALVLLKEYLKNH
ncbi:unnamed protein product [Phytomonas sp. EM1]|nr:unnamed protein product [Phytomonas sp. EM1]|eukprot:CCW63876.1 unnamed protein product [Phytomonas sp. isolate EM1]